MAGKTVNFSSFASKFSRSIPFHPGDGSHGFLDKVLQGREMNVIKRLNIETRLAGLEFA